MASIATSKSGVIDRMSVTAVTAITPCIGGLVIWYSGHDGEHPAPNSTAATKREPTIEKSDASRRAAFL